MKRTLGMLFVAACVAAAEEKTELHIYNTSALTVRISNFRGPRLGFDAIPDGSLGIGTVGGEEEGSVITGENLKYLVATNVAPGTWDSPPNSVEYQNGELIVRCSPANQVKVKEFLAALRSHEYRTVVVDAQVLELAPGVLDVPAGSLLTDAQVQAADAAVADPAKGRRLASLRASGLNTQRFHAAAIQQDSYLRDFDVEIAQKMAIADPDVALLDSGYSLDVRPTLSSDGKLVLLTARFSSADGVTFRTFQPGGPVLGDMQEPELAAARTQTTLAIPVGRTAVLSAASYSGARDGWTQVVLVRPDVAAGAVLPWPAAAGKTQARRFDTRAILYAPPLFEGPRLGGLRPSGDGAGAGGTSFSIPDSDKGLLLTADQLQSMVTQNVGRDTWESPEGAVSLSVGNEQLFVRQTPQVLEEVQALVDRLTADRARQIAVDAWVVGLDEATWRDRRAALSADISDAAWNDLLLAASAGKGARLHGAARAAGLNGTRFHAARGLVRSLVLDHDVEVADGASSLDPVVSTVAEGVSLDVTPASVGDSGQVQLDLRPTVVLGSGVQTVPLKEKQGAVQTMTLSDFGIRTQLLVEGGKPALVGVATREEGGKTEVLVLVVRATVIDMK